MQAEEPILRNTLAARDRLVELERELEPWRVEFHQGVRRLHSSGLSMREIAGFLGLSHQRVHQIVNGRREAAAEPPRATLLSRLVKRSRKNWESGDKPPSGHDGLLDRFFVDARDAMSHAQEEALALGHAYLGTEHLLLGLIRTEHGLAARILAAMGVDLDASRIATARLAGSGETNSWLATARLKRVIELSQTEAKEHRSTHVRSEYLLLGLAREGDGLGARILTDFGVRYDRVRRRVDRAAITCSFCRRSGFDVEHLIAGPGTYICDYCVEEAGHVLVAGSVGEAQSLLLEAAPETKTGACSFCGKNGPRVVRSAGVDPAHPPDGSASITAGVSICTGCLALCREIETGEIETAQGK